MRFESPVRTTELALTEATARVTVPPSREAVIGATLAGLLTSLSVDVGQSVREGQHLAALRSPDFLALQREYLDALNTWLLALTEFERDSQLNQEGIISERRLEESTTRKMIAASSLNEHRQLLRIAGLDARQIAELERSQVLVESMDVHAPFDGVVLERSVTIGQRLDAMAPIFRIADLSELWLQINMPQEHVARVATGMSAAGDGFRATVTGIAGTIDPATQSVLVRAAVTSGADRLRPGQFVVVRMVAPPDGAGDAGAWSVPGAAIIRSEDVLYLFVRTAGGVEVRSVETAGASEGGITVTRGLREGDQVAVSGIAALKAMWSSRDGGTD